MKKVQSTRSKTIESLIKRVNKLSISEEIAHQIMELIADGSLKPGQRLLLGARALPFVWRQPFLFA